MLEAPRKLGPVQRDFNIEKQGSYIISVKNPDVETPQGRPSLQGQWKANIPEDVKQVRRLLRVCCVMLCCVVFHAEIYEEISCVQESFGGKLRFASSSHFLNYGGTEVVMIGSSSDLDKEFGMFTYSEKTLSNEHDTKLFVQLMLEWKVTSHAALPATN
jgi:hypothetical protein